MFTYNNILSLIKLKELKVKNELKHIENIKKLLELYPDLEDCYNDNTSWIVSESVNSIVDRCLIYTRNNSIELQAWIQTEFGVVYTSPPILFIGKYSYDNIESYTPSNDLEFYLINTKISKFVIESIHDYFKDPSWRKECIKTS